MTPDETRLWFCTERKLWGAIRMPAKETVLPPQFTTREKAAKAVKLLASGMVFP